ncbi:hypothetical protein M2G36_20895 [Vibrio vulnificus]|nr:hypothetical protein [Vibrio vulnificus]
MKVVCEKLVCAAFTP